MVGSATPNGQPQVTKEDHVGRAGERGITWTRREGKKWRDRVAEDRRTFGITGDDRTNRRTPKWASIAPIWKPGNPESTAL